MPTTIFGKKKATKLDIDAIEILDIDSLKQAIYQDTIKYDENDLIFNAALGRMNKNSYSMLYIVNGSYLYMLDIITSDKVLEFANEILDVDKIDDICIIPTEAAVGFEGVRATNGVVVISLKKNVKFNPIVAGLEERDVKYKRKIFRVGDNFTKRKENEMMLHFD
jgi:hypothetical protein